MRGIGARIERRAQPVQLGGDARADAGRVLADAGSEYERVDPAQRRRQHAGIKPDAIDRNNRGQTRPAGLRSIAARARRC